MRYLGSKTLLLNNISEIISEYNNTGVFCDPFGGIGTVGRQMKKNGYTVVSGDILNFAHYFQMALIENNSTNIFSELKKFLCVDCNEGLENYLSNIEAEAGWLIKEYAEDRCFFTVENARHIQGCMDQIIQWKNENMISEMEYAILMASLINSFDCVANTAGTYYAYLKNYYRKAKKNFKYKILETTVGSKSCKTYLMDANELVKNTSCTVLYLDPPYNDRDYGRYYHLPETISQGFVPEPIGESGMSLAEHVRSKYNTRKAADAFEELIQNADARCIIFHYTDNGIISEGEVRRILSGKGKIEEFYFDCKGYNTTKITKSNQHHIYKVVT